MPWNRDQRGTRQVFWEQSVQCATETDIGLRRKNNEDAACTYLCNSESEWRQSGHLFVVADGMGGHAVGELASRIAVETVPHTFLKSVGGDPRKALLEAVTAANQAIHSRGTQNVDFHHMGTTCTALVLCSRGAVVGHVGDSRAYRIRRDRIDQLTFDHSLEWELERQHGSLSGLVDLSQHRNVITRSLGPEASIEIDVEGPYLTLPGDLYVLCSDGLSNQVSDPEIGAIVRELSPRQAARMLVHLANLRGGPDNSTVVVVRVGDLPANVTPTLPDDTLDDQESLGWSWLIGFWIGALALVAGLAMLMFGRPVPGTICTALAVGMLVALTIGAVRRQRDLVRKRPDLSQTNLWRPYRTAVALSSKELYELLVAIEIDLQRSAREDGWNVRWADHQAALVAAHQAGQEKRYARGIRDLARAIEVMMDQLPRASAVRASHTTD